MRVAGTGTILIAAGSGAINPAPYSGTHNAAHAATHDLALNPNGQPTATGVHATYVVLGADIKGSAPAEGYPFKTPAALPEECWQLHIERATADPVMSQLTRPRRWPMRTFVPARSTDQSANETTAFKY